MKNGIQPKALKNSCDGTLRLNKATNSSSHHTGQNHFNHLNKKSLTFYSDSGAVC
jgi:hypothetical protein